MKKQPIKTIEEAVAEYGARFIAEACGVTRQAVERWVASGRMPWTDFIGQTNYAAGIEAATGGRVRKSALLQRMSA